jgi:hypothetical protein
MARYWVLVSKELLDSKPRWSDVGLTAEMLVPANPRGVLWWVKFNDANAPAELDGSVVELTFAMVDGKPEITGRYPVS